MRQVVTGNCKTCFKVGHASSAGHVPVAIDDAAQDLKTPQATRGASSPLSYRRCMSSRLYTLLILLAMPALPKAW